MQHSKAEPQINRTTGAKHKLLKHLMWSVQKEGPNETKKEYEEFVSTNLETNSHNH